jgi:hypothetical protein
VQLILQQLAGKKVQTGNMVHKRRLAALRAGYGASAP